MRTEQRLVLTKDQIHLSRRSLLGCGGGVILGGAGLMPSTLRAAVVKPIPTRPELRCGRPRVVAYQSPPEQIDQPFSTVCAMDWVASQVGGVDLIAFHAVVHAITAGEIATLSVKAAEQSCYVALGVQRAGDKGRDLMLIGPDGNVVADGSHLESVICETDIGRIAMSAGFNSNLKHMERDIDLVIHSAGRDDLCVQPGSYVVNLTVGASGTGSTIYAPDGAPVTSAGAGWTQGIVATIDVAGLKRRRKQETEPSA